jgi:hypothetical protein
MTVVAEVRVLDNVRRKTPMEPWRNASLAVDQMRVESGLETSEEAGRYRVRGDPSASDPRLAL